MIRFSFNEKENPVFVTSPINTIKHENTNSKLKDGFIRHFNERDYKKHKIEIFKKICEKNNSQLITDYDIETSKNVNVKAEFFTFVVFDYMKFLNLINSLITSSGKDFYHLTECANFYLIIDIEDIFDAFFKIGFAIKEISFTPYELFSKKAMLNLGFYLENSGYYIDKEIFSMLESYNYIYNHAFELIKTLSEKYSMQKIFDVIDSQETPEAKELKKLFDTFSSQ